MRRVRFKIGMVLLLSLMLASCGRNGDEPRPLRAANTRIRRLQKVIDQQKATIKSLRRQLEKGTNGESGSARRLAGITEPMRAGGGVE